MHFSLAKIIRIIKNKYSNNDDDDDDDSVDHYQHLFHHVCDDGKVEEGNRRMWLGIIIAMMNLDLHKRAKAIANLRTVIQQHQ